MLCFLDSLAKSCVERRCALERCMRSPPRNVRRDNLEPLHGVAGVTYVQLSCPEPAVREAADLYNDSYERLVRTLAFACGSVSDAEEIVQEAFVRLIPRGNEVSR